MAGGGGRDRPRVGMVLYGDLTYDSRVRKEARTLALGAYDVSIVCLAAEAEPRDLPANVRVIVCAAVDPSALPGGANPFRSSSSGRLRSLAGGVGWLLAYAGNLRAWGRSAIAACGPVDIWHAHDLTGLAALGPVAGKNLPIVYDSHELYLETGTASRLPKPARTLLRHYEHRLVSGASAVVTVNEEIADVLRRRYQPRRIEIVHNCPDRWSPPAVRPEAQEHEMSAIEPGQ
jgi:glycogen(starch) synthase